MSSHTRMVVSIAVVLVTAFGAFTAPSTSFAHGVLIYSTSGGRHNRESREQQMIDVRILDALIGQIRHDYKVVEDTNIRGPLARYDYVIYFGAVRKQLPAALVDAINEYNGPFYALNDNTDQFTARLRWLTLRGRVEIDGVGGALRGRGARARGAPLEPPGGRGQELPEVVTVHNVGGQGARVTLSGRRADGRRSVAVALHAGDDYYFAAGDLHPPMDGYVTESLLAFFGEEDPRITKYLRLEDVHPLSDPRLLMEQATWLKDREIPYMVATIPVYQHGNGDIVHLYEMPDVENALQYMQDNGGSIVMHGYTHRFRAEESGEGFEFWDAENDRPIYQPAGDRPRFRSDFATEAEWGSFVRAGEAFERSHMEDRIRRGVEELVAHRLYPVAFEPPHYAVSQQGYKILSRHFSSYVGQLQMSDSTWQSGFGPPYESRPRFVHGMTVFTETLGFIEQGNEQASLERMRAALVSRSQFSRAYLAAFYHPYLGLDGLTKVVDLLNRVPGTWLDLKRRRNRVQVGGIRISTQNGEIDVDKPFWASAYERDLWIRRRLRWAVPGVLVVLTAVGFLVVRREMRQKV